MEATPPQGAAMAQAEGSKLPPVLAKLMDNLSSGSSFRSPQAANAAAPVNVQELLSSIMVNPASARTGSPTGCCCPTQRPAGLTLLSPPTRACQAASPRRS